MDGSSALNVAGLICTVVFGGLSVVFYLRRRYPGKIDFVLEQAIPLFDAIVKNLPNISIQYVGKAINPNLIFLAGAFVNSGDKDITLEMIEKELEINLPKAYRWMEANVYSKSKGCDASISCSEDKLIVSKSMFRCGENIKFHALVEVGEPLALQAKIQLARDLKFYHRISDTADVKIVEIGEDTKAFWRKKKYIGHFIEIALGIGLITWAFFYSSYVLASHFQKDDGSIVDIRIISVDEKNVSFTSLDGNFSGKLSFAEFFSHLRGQVTPVEDKSGSKALFILGVLLAASYAYSLIGHFWRRKRLNELLALLDSRERI